jgi:hypothetical protein
MSAEPQKSRNHWSQAGDILRGWKFRAGIDSDRIMILNQVWEREMGHYSRHWTLSGVKRGFLYVKPKSAAAAQELTMMGAQIVRSLNKYFKKAWIKGIRLAR